MYVAAYTFVRFFVESLRIDEAKNIAGLRLNQWTSLVVFACAVIYMAITKNKSTNLASEDASQDPLG